MDFGNLGLQLPGLHFVHYGFYAWIIGIGLLIDGFAAAIIGMVYYYRRFGRGRPDVYIQIDDPEPYDYSRQADIPSTDIQRAA